MQTKILVTGATGNVGSEVVKELVKRNQHVVAGVRDMARAKKQLGDNTEYVGLDFKQPATYQAALQDVKKIFLMRPPDVADTKKHILPFIEAAKRAGVEHIVFLSLLGVEKNHMLPHYAMEQILMQSGIAWTFLRASFFMQNLNTTHRYDIKEHQDIFVPAGRGKTSFIDVRAIAAVGVLTLAESGHEHKAYNLTGSEALDYFEVAREFSRVLGKPIRYSNPSPLKFGWEMWYKRKTALPFVLVMIAIYTTARFGLAGRLEPDTEQLLGRKPITIGQYIEDYKENWL